MTSRKSEKKFSALKNQRGVALIVAFFFMLLSIFLVEEVSRTSLVEFTVSGNDLHELKAYYAAKSGVEVGLLRVLLYKKANAALGGELTELKSALNMIWQLPFSWPPELPEGVARIDKEKIETIVKDSLMKSSYTVLIESEGSKIDINDLDSGSEALAKSTREQLLKVFKNELETNEEFREKYESFDFGELINNIADWVDENSDSLNGGPESNLYSDYEDAELPPNQAFKTLKEIRLVAGMNDDFFNILKDKVTVYGNKGININTASPEVLKSIDEQIKDETVKVIQERINDPDKGGPFKDLEDFTTYLEKEADYFDSSNFNPLGIPLYFNDEFNFHIFSYGRSKGTKPGHEVIKTIEVVTYDIDALSENLITALDKDDKDKGKDKDKEDEASPPAPKTEGDTAADKTDKSEAKKEDTKKKKIPTGRPTIIYWNES